MDGAHLFRAADSRAGTDCQDAWLQSARRNRFTRGQGHRMITRRNVLVLGFCAATVSSTLHAQQAGKVARIGFLYFGARSSDGGRYSAFMQGMRDQGLVEGRDFTVEARFADGKAERAPALAADLVRLKVDVIVATGSAIYRALQRE